MALSDYAANALLNSLFSKTSNLGALATAPTVYVALCSTLPTPANTGSTITECSYTGYSRKVSAASDWAAAGGRELSNTNALSFAQCTAGSSTANSFALCDASSAGNVLAFGALTTSPVAVTSITVSGTTATVTQTAHGYSVGDSVLVQGVEDPNFNGWQVVASTTTNTWTFAIPNAPASPAVAATGVSITAAKSSTLAISVNITPQFGAGTLVNALS